MNSGTVWFVFSLDRSSFERNNFWIYLVFKRCSGEENLVAVLVLLVEGPQVEKTLKNWWIIDVVIEKMWLFYKGKVCDTNDYQWLQCFLIWIISSSGDTDVASITPVRIFSRLSLSGHGCWCRGLILGQSFLSSCSARSPLQDEDHSGSHPH